MIFGASRRLLALSPAKEEFLKKFKTRINMPDAVTLKDVTNPSNHVDPSVEAAGSAGACVTSDQLSPTLPPVCISVPPKFRNERLPSWLRAPKPSPEGQSRVQDIRKTLKGGAHKLATVCEEARCPNLSECWGGEDGAPATATIMLMGDTCTRACRFCSVKTGKTPPPLDPLEPTRVADAVKGWGVDYIVMTMVDRDDLPDGGAAHVAATVKAIKAASGGRLLVETLTGDFSGDPACVKAVVDAGVDVFAHNVETTRTLTPSVRDRRASFDTSISVLRAAKEIKPTLITKTSIMLGLGETDEDVEGALRELRDAGVDAVTLGQYLQPSKTRRKVSRYVHPDEFDAWKAKADEVCCVEVGFCRGTVSCGDSGFVVGKSFALQMGFLYCASGPMVRSSYRAGEHFLAAQAKMRAGSAQ